MNLDKVQQSLPVLILLAAITGIGPGSSCVAGYLTKSKEIEIAEKDLKFKRDLAFFGFDRSHPVRSPEDRKQVLEVLVATTEDGPIRTWAQGKLSAVTEEVTKLKKDLKETQRQGYPPQRGERRQLKRRSRSGQNLRPGDP